jgi:hypothetical protein
MDRPHYLADPDVRGFTDYLRRLVIEGTGVALRIGRGSRRRSVATVLEAQQAYRWRGRDYDQATTDLDRFREEMLQTLTICGDGVPGCQPCLAEYELLYICTKILEWGNSLNGVLTYVQERAQAEALSESLTRAAALIDGDSDDTRAFEDPQLQSGPRICKIYSVMNERTVTYGGRIAAALCLLCRHYLATQPDPTVVPKLIDFPRTAAHPRRNPSVANGPTFRRVTDCCEHARWNIRANWVLNAVASSEEVTTRLGGSVRDRIRCLEAGLFMIGDNVQAQPIVAGHGPVHVSHPHQVYQAQRR